MSLRRLRGMTSFPEVPPDRAASLTTSKLETAQHVWDVAGLPPTSGYGTIFLAAAITTDETVAAALNSVDLDDAGSVTDAAEVLLQWRQRTIHVTA